MTDGSHTTASAASRSTHGPSEQEGKRALTGLLHMRVATDAEGGWSSDPTRKRLHATEEIWAGEWDPHSSVRG